MKNEFDYQEVPYDFAHCLNDQCTQVNHCLRHLAAANSTSIRKFFPIVNPAHYPKERDKCPFFKSQIKKRIALGITNLLDNVPHKTALLLRRQMVEHFGKTLYYRFLRKENELLPEHQIVIKQLFEQNGINEEPVFDSYRESFDW